MGRTGRGGRARAAVGAGGLLLALGAGPLAAQGTDAAAEPADPATCGELRGRLLGLQNDRNRLRSGGGETFGELKIRHDRLLGLDILQRGMEDPDGDDRPHAFVKKALEDRGRRADLAARWIEERRRDPRGRPALRAARGHACGRGSRYHCQLLEEIQGEEARRWDRTVGGLLAAWSLAAGGDVGKKPRELIGDPPPPRAAQLNETKDRINAIMALDAYESLMREKDELLAMLPGLCDGLRPEDAAGDVLCDNPALQFPFGEVRKLAGSLDQVLALLGDPERVRARTAPGEEAVRRRRRARRFLKAARRRRFVNGRAVRRPGTGGLLAGAFARSMPDVSRLLMTALYKPNHDHLLLQATFAKNAEHAQNLWRERLPDYWRARGTPPCAPAHAAFCGGSFIYFNPFLGPGAQPPAAAP